MTYESFQVRYEGTKIGYVRKLSSGRFAYRYKGTQLWVGSYASSTGAETACLNFHKERIKCQIRNLPSQST